MENFIAQFAELLDDTPLSALTPETKFKDLDDWNSLMALEVIALADETYNVTLSGDDIRQAVTLSDLFSAIASKK